MTDLITPAAPSAVAVLANQIQTALCKAYPTSAEGWYIEIDTHGGLVTVRNLLISGKMGFRIPILSIDPEMRKIVRYAGELLERYKIARKKGTDMREAIRNLEYSPIGEARYES